MSDLIYIMHCGCHLSESDLIKVRAAKRCPRHPKSGVKQRQYQCQDCGKTITRGPIGRLGRCRDCQNKRKIANDREIYYQAKGMSVPTDASIRVSTLAMSPQQEIAASRYDCTHRAACLLEAAHAPRVQALPCQDCENYTSAHAATIGTVRTHGDDYSRRESA